MRVQSCLTTVYWPCRWPEWCLNAAEKSASSATWTRFTTVTEVQSFLGLANYYRRFNRDFVRISAPLPEWKKKGSPFEWRGEKENSFQNPKDAVKSAPELQLADPAKPYIVT
jgi:hypothetical protein